MLVIFLSELQKFQEISSAYKRLTTQDEEDDVELSYVSLLDILLCLCSNLLLSLFPDQEFASLSW